MLKLNKELITQSKEKMYYEKNLKKVVYEPLEDNYLAFEVLFEDILNLLDIPEVDFLWYNKNSRNLNLFKDKLDEVKEVKIGKKIAKKIFENILECLEDVKDHL